MLYLGLSLRVQQSPLTRWELFCSSIRGARPGQVAGTSSHLAPGVAEMLWQHGEGVVAFSSGRDTEPFDGERDQTMRKGDLQQRGTL